MTPNLRLQVKENGRKISISVPFRLMPSSKTLISACTLIIPSCEQRSSNLKVYLKLLSLSSPMPT